MPCQDHVDAGDIHGELPVHVEAVVGEKDNDLGARVTDLLHDFGDPFTPEPEAEFREHPAGVGNGHVGEGLPDHADGGAVPLEHAVAVVDRLVPFDVEDIGSEECRIDMVLDQFVGPVPNPA